MDFSTDCVVHITNLPQNITIENINETFVKGGEITKIILGRGEALVFYADEDEAQGALIYTQIGDNEVEVEMADKVTLREIIATQTYPEESTQNEESTTQAKDDYEVITKSQVQDEQVPPKVEVPVVEKKEIDIPAPVQHHVEVHAPHIEPPKPVVEEIKYVEKVLEHAAESIATKIEDVIHHRSDDVAHHRSEDVVHHRTQDIVHEVQQPKVEEHKPVVVEQPKPVVIEEHKPVVIEQPKPVVVEQPKPVVVEEHKPVVIEQPKPVVVEQPKPVVVEQPKPVVVEQPKPVVVEQPKPVVVEQPKPVVVEQPSHSTVQHPKPVEEKVEEPKSCSVKLDSVQLLRTLKNTSLPERTQPKESDVFQNVFNPNFLAGLFGLLIALTIFSQVF